MTLPLAVVCPACGASEADLVRERRSVTADDGTELAFEEEFSRCRACGVEHYTRDQSLAASRARAAALRAHEGLLSPLEIRAIRGRLGYTQAQLEKVLGVGAKTVVRWEKGTVRQSRLADRFLRTLAANPQVVYESAVSAMASAFGAPATTRVTSYGYVTTLGGFTAVGTLSSPDMFMPVSLTGQGGGITVFASTPMFIAADVFTPQPVRTGPGTMRNRVAEALGVQLDVFAANSELAEAA